MKIWKEAAAYKHRRRLHVSVSTFVPKPHTPFQWESQLSLTDIRKNIDFFKQRLRKRGLQFKWHQPWQSILEGIFSRGDRRLAQVLLKAQKLSCRFDGWSDQLRVDLWQQAFAETGIEPLSYGQRFRDMEEKLPWSHLDCGVSTDYLWNEYEKALAEEFTSDCRTNGCNTCGVCDHTKVRLQLHEETMSVSDARISPAEEKDELYPYRLVFAKLESARFLSHLEMVSGIKRAMRRANMPLAYSRGYHPTARISFGDALPLGLESKAEEMEVTLRKPWAPADICERLNSELPTGLQILAASEADKTRQQTTCRVDTYEARLAGEDWSEEGLHRFQSRSLSPLRQASKRGETIIPLADRLIGLEKLDVNTIRIILTQDGHGKIRVRELFMHIFDVPKERILEARIVKISSQSMEG
jgi:radical SAM-linked protein